MRTTAPNETWHIDVTIIKLLDGTKAYVHAVIDNFSRRILAWTIAGRLDPMNTHDVLTRAAGHLVASTKADAFMDSGVENLNGDVDPLFDGGALQRVIAQTDVSFSNSLIEAWWRALKHRWLFLHPLDNLATVKRLIEFYGPSTTSGSIMARSKATHPTRCTSVAVLTSPTISSSGDAKRKSGACSRTKPRPALLAAAVLQCRASTSPRESFARFHRELAANALASLQLQDVQRRSRQVLQRVRSRQQTE